MKKLLLSLFLLGAIVNITQAQIIITGYLVNPAGTDSPFEYVQLTATQNINFATDPYTVVVTNNGTAVTSGWIAGGSLTYNFNLTTGTVNRGDVFYVGGDAKLINGTGSTNISSSNWIRVINTGTTVGDNFGSSNASGVMGNGGGNADGIGVFLGIGSALTAASIPLDAIFFGTGVGTAKPVTGGYTLPNNDLYSTAQGTFGNGTNTFLFSDPASGAFVRLSGVYNTSTNLWTTPRTSSTVTLTTTSLISDISSLTTLPITLTSFTGKEANKSIVLNWVTASEKNNKNFEILRSVDGKTFKSIGTVNGAGDSNSELKYAFLDANPFGGTNYYQLKQIDFDGKNSTSATIAVDSKIEDTQITVYAASSSVNIGITSPNETLGKVTLLDISGRKITEQNISLNKGYNTLELNQTLTPGVHFVTLENEGRIYRQKFIK